MGGFTTAAVTTGITLAKVASAAKIAAAAGATTASFVKAKQANKAQQKAEKAASDALADARKRLDVNYLEDLLNVLDALAIAEEEDALAQATSTQVSGTLLGKDPDTQITTIITGNVISNGVLVILVSFIIFTVFIIIIF